MDANQMPTFALWTSTERERIAIIDADGTRISVGELLDRTNQVARQLRNHGIQKGDAVAICLKNCSQVLEIALATAQIGVYLVPVNRHLTAFEVGYIVNDSGAKVVICSAEYAPLCVGNDAQVFAVGNCEFDGVKSYAELCQGATDAPENRTAGGVMTYTSGTTGQPKGVRRPLPPAPPEPVASAYAMFLLMYGMTPGQGVHLVVSPLYHTAVMYFATSALHLGHQVVIMDKWTPGGMLAAIETHKVTSSHMVPTQFVRLLDYEERHSFDVSSLKHMIHSAAPCPVPIKHAMLDWWGPVVYEYYAASEGGGTMVTPKEWLERPGTVGKAWQTAEIAIFDDEGERSPANEVGTVYIKMSQAFKYHGDEEKTDQAWRKDGYFTVGDAGYLDDEGYLFLCDRKADMIISGGVNIYPAEIEAALIAHPFVLDVAVFGIPDPDWGEQVKAVIEAKGSVDDELEESIMSWARERLAKYKCPRTIDFTDALPRDPNGKLKKRLLRDPYWEGRERQI
jgi:long-chain acyl-CoA synthetase